MKRKYIIVALMFILFMNKTVAQKQERVLNNPEIQNLLKLSESIQSGEISFAVEKERKEDLMVETKEYQISFFKTGKFIRLMLIDEIYYNLLNTTDSMQYIYNGEAWYVIDHKNKICTIDTSYYCTSASPAPIPLVRPYSVFSNDLFRFYRGEILIPSFTRATAIKEIQKNENITLIEMVTSDSQNDKEVLFAEEYEWDTSKSLLLRHSKTVKDDSACLEKDIVKTETRLINASLNDEKYRDAALYDGLNFAKSYKIEYRDSKDE